MPAKENRGTSPDLQRIRHPACLQLPACSCQPFILAAASCQGARFACVPCAAGCVLPKQVPAGLPGSENNVFELDQVAPGNVSLRIEMTLYARDVNSKLQNWWVQALALCNQQPACRSAAHLPPASNQLVSQPVGGPEHAGRPVSTCFPFRFNTAGLDLGRMLSSWIRWHGTCSGSII